MKVSMKKSLGMASLIAVGAALSLPLLAAAESVTMVVTATVDSIENDVWTGYQVVGSAVKDSSIPVHIGDELRFIFTYDPATLANQAAFCTEGGNYDFSASSTVGSLYSDHYMAAVSAPVISVRTGCLQLHDTFNVHSSPTSMLSGEPIEALPLAAIEMSLYLSADCFDVSPSLPTGSLGAGTCALYGAAGNGGDINLLWLANTGGTSSSWVQIHARQNVSVGSPSCGDLIAGLASDVFRLNLQHGISNSLDAKLGAAIKAADGTSSNNNSTAISEIYSFKNAVSAQSGKSIGQGEADALTATADSVIACLSH